jgi:cold shock CspA family protein
MITGTIKTWNDDRGFGFIARDDGAADVFAHVKYCAPGFRPSPGLRVAFEVVADERAPANRGRADNIDAVSPQ